MHCPQFYEFSFPNSISSSTDDIAQAINATVTDHAGHDITSSFEVMVFYNPSSPRNNTPRTNSSMDDGLANRDVGVFRQINYCMVPGTTFVHSECTPTDNNNVANIRSYDTTCHRTKNMYHPYTGEFLYSRPVVVRRNGHCWHDEVCVNGYGPGNELISSIGMSIATCVNRKMFHVVKPIGLKLDKAALARSFEGKRLSMVVSKTDESTPIEVDTLDVEAKGASMGDADGAGVGRCKGCADLETQQFKKGVESLKAEAKMLTTGAAVAGILWMALL